MHVARHESAMLLCTCMHAYCTARLDTHTLNPCMVHGGSIVGAGDISQHGTIIETDLDQIGRWVIHISGVLAPASLLS
jgi:hypothetical protein